MILLELLIAGVAFSCGLFHAPIYWWVRGVFNSFKQKGS